MNRGVAVSSPVGAKIVSTLLVNFNCYLPAPEHLLAKEIATPLLLRLGVPRDRVESILDGPDVSLPLNHYAPKRGRFTTHDLRDLVGMVVESLPLGYRSLLAATFDFGTPRVVDVSWSERFSDSNHLMSLYLRMGFHTLRVAREGSETSYTIRLSIPDGRSDLTYAMEDDLPGEIDRLVKKYDILPPYRRARLETDKT